MVLPARLRVRDGYSGSCRASSAFSLLFSLKMLRR